MFLFLPSPPAAPSCFSLACSKVEAEAIENELREEFRFGHQQLIEIWGHACAMAVTKVSSRQLWEAGAVGGCEWLDHRGGGG